jgi:trehalose 6-phosphate phosphatase
MDAFFDGLHEARERLLMLDYDGTLAPFTDNPSEVRPYPEVMRLLDEIMSWRRNRVVIVTGRSLALTPPPLPLMRRPELWGEHGWQQEVAGGLRVWNPPTEARAALSMAAERARDVEAWGARIERKCASIAVHWRGTPEPAAQAIETEVARRWAALPLPGLAAVKFDGGMELRACARHKGKVVRELLAHAPDDTAAAYLGDDRTDEDAFQAITGRGIGVLVRRTWRPTSACGWLTPPAGLIGFLERWRDAS